MPEHEKQCNEHSGCEARIGNLEISDGRQWDAITKIQNRLPVWATLMMSTITFFMGCALTYAGLVSQMMEMKK